MQRRVQADFAGCIHVGVRVCQPCRGHYERRNVCLCAMQERHPTPDSTTIALGVAPPTRQSLLSNKLLHTFCSRGCGCAAQLRGARGEAACRTVASEERERVQSEKKNR